MIQNKFHAWTFQNQKRNQCRRSWIRCSWKALVLDQCIASLLRFHWLLLWNWIGVFLLSCGKEYWAELSDIACDPSLWFGFFLHSHECLFQFYLDQKNVRKVVAHLHCTFWQLFVFDGTLYIDQTYKCHSDIFHPTVQELKHKHHNEHFLRSLEA